MSQAGAPQFPVSAAKARREAESAPRGSLTIWDLARSAPAACPVLSCRAQGPWAQPCCLAPQESLFPARVVYDLLFFFIVIIIVLNLIFGVIIDTFADLRSEKQKKEEILKTTCFICGEARPLQARAATAREAVPVPEPRDRWTWEGAVLCGP